jgi:hypothetical protein
VIDSVHPLTRVEEALAVLEGRSQFGKVLVEP